MPINFELYNWEDEVLDISGQSDSGPRYLIRDNSGKILYENVQIDLQTPTLKAGTPINRGTLRDLENKLWKVGEVKLFGTPIEKENTKLCDGKYLFASEYPELATAIGSEIGFSLETSNIRISSPQRMAYGKNKLVSFANNTSQFCYSEDGKNWSVGTSSGSLKLSNFVYNESDGYFYASSPATNLASQFTYGGIYRSNNGTYFSTHKTWTGNHDCLDICICDDGDVWGVGEDGYMATKSGGDFIIGSYDRLSCGNTGNKFFCTYNTTTVHYFTGTPSSSNSSYSSLSVPKMLYFRKVNGILFGLGLDYLLQFTSTPSTITRISGSDISYVDDITFDGTYYYVIINHEEVRKYNTNWSLVGRYVMPYSTDTKTIYNLISRGKNDVLVYSTVANEMFQLNDLIYLPEYDVSKRQYAYIRTAL